MAGDAVDMQDICLADAMRNSDRLCAARRRREVDTDNRSLLGLHKGNKVKNYQ
jgi:hypothetical protein